MSVTFHGVRGSTPCHGEEIVRYGGNTSCVSLDVPGHDPILFDLGTGLRYFGRSLSPGVPFQGTCLLSHLHWDHIQGLPFFTPLLVDGAHVAIYAPDLGADLSAQQIFAETIKPPLFPVELAALPGELTFHEVTDSDFSIGDVEVTSRIIPHVGSTVGYRVTWNDTSVAYLPDHQMPLDGSLSATRGALELCAGADLVIHDSQYTPEEFALKNDWGHCTLEFAVWMAAEAGARRLALFHHDPAHHDDELDELVEEAIRDGARRGVEVFPARENRTVVVGDPPRLPS
jgi:phosphoribosyl 1,2-cyclic phosphodiesterase